MRQRARSGSVAIASLVSGIAMMACQDATSPTPRTAVPNSAVSDAIAAAPEMIVLHGTKGRVARYAIKNGRVTLDIGTGETRSHTARPGEIAFLRNAGQTDQLLQFRTA